MKRSQSFASPSLLSFYDSKRPAPLPPQYFLAESPHDLLQGYKFLTKELQKLSLQVRNLRKEVRGVAEESSMWTLKYSRRIVMVSNLLLSVYILGKRGLDLVYNINSRSMLLGLLFNPFNWFQKSSQNLKRRNGVPKRQMKQPEPQFKLMLIQLLWKQLAMSGCLLFSSYWLMSRDKLRRSCGIVLTFVTNIYLAITTDVSPWTIYFNCFTLLMYITARFVRNKPIMNTIKSNIQRTLSLSVIATSNPQNGENNADSFQQEGSSFHNFLQKNSQIRSEIDEWHDCKIQLEMISPETSSLYRRNMSTPNFHQGRKDSGKQKQKKLTIVTKSKENTTQDS